MNIISIKQLNSGYGKLQILHDVDFAAQNNLTIIVGANGSGKSTLLKSIYGLCDVYGGTITYKDKQIQNIAPHMLATLGISYMPQRNNVFFELTIQENLIIANHNIDFEHIFELFPVLKKYLYKKATVLSGGQRQLLAMAMALATSPSILLLDEPTANLSPKNAGMVLDKIKEIRQKLNCCVIMVEQNVLDSLKICDVCYLFSGGSVIFHGDPQQLLSDKSLGKKYLGM